MRGDPPDESSDNRDPRALRRGAFGKQVRAALAHLDDRGYLQTHPLAHRAARQSTTRLSRDAGVALRQALVEAIGALRPADGLADHAHAWRSYRILSLRYLEGLDISAVQQRLAISKSEYYRDYRTALAAVISLLRERWAAGETLPQPGEPWPAAPARLQSAAALPLTSFVGREQELDAVKRLLLAGARLVTLTGPGGSGKTRLAQRVADELVSAYPDGVWLVELAALADSALVTPTIAVALGVREDAAQPMAATIVRYLAGKRLLLVLENCEHLLQPCARIVEAVLQGCPSVQILATSRAPLGLGAERLWRVPPLGMADPDHLPAAPDDLPGRLLQHDAIRLFVDRAVAARPDFRLTRQNAPAVARICWDLDGLPLAIELAAARLKALTAEQIAQRLGDRFHLLTGGRGILPRQQTLQATMEWSEALLSESERALFRRLSVFAGRFSLEAAEALDDPGANPSVLDRLTALIDHSLVQVDEADGELRYRLLETTRAYAWRRLEETGEVELVCRRHAAWYARLAATAEPNLWGGSQLAWLKRLQLERDNLRAALAWSLDHDTVLGLQMVGSLWRFWWVRGYFGEGRHWLDALLARERPAMLADGERWERLRSNALLGLGFLARDQGDLATAQRCSEEALARFRAGDQPRGVAMALFNLALLARSAGDVLAASRLLQESLAIFRAIDDQWGVGETLYILGTSARSAGDYDRAEALLEESLRALKTIDDRWGVSWVLSSLGNLARVQGDFGWARRRYEESLALAREMGDTWGAGWTLAYLGNLGRAQRRLDEARAHYEDSLAIFRGCGASWGMAYCQLFLSMLAIEQGDPALGVQLIATAAGHPLFPTSLAPDEQRDCDASLATARQALGEATFARSWSAGTTDAGLAWGRSPPDRPGPTPGASSTRFR